MVDITFWMIKDPATTTKDTTIFDAVQIMKNKNSDAIIIVEQNKPLGIFTERDLLKKVVAERKNPDITKIQDVMTSPIATITKEKPYPEVLAHMKEKNYRHIPVVDDSGVIIGLVTLQGLIKK